MEPNTGIFKIFLLDQSNPRQQEGFLKLWKHKGVLLEESKPIPFNYLDEIPGKVRKLLKNRGIDWPKQSK